MIYALMSDGTRLIVLEPGNFARLREGKPAFTPDKSVMLCYAPDLRWTAEELEKAVANGRLTGEALGKVLEAGLSRPEVHGREYHPKIIFGEEPR